MPSFWPWSRNRPNLPPKAITPEDLEQALAQQAEEYERRTALVAQETAETVQRALYNGSAPFLPQFPTLAGNYPNNAQRHPIFAFNYPYQYLVPQAPYIRPESTVSLTTLRQVADSYDILRSCLSHLKRETFATELRFVGRDPKADVTARIKEVEAFFGLNGGLGGISVTREEYEGRLLEDLLVIGVGTAWYEYNRGRTLLSTLAIDASTIRPRVDAYGWPGPDDVWYEQWVQGIPVSLNGYKRDELWFRGLPHLQRSWTPYPASQVEFLVSVVDTALRSDAWNKGWLTDGSTVSEKHALPQDWTPEQVIQWQQHWDNMLSGNTAERQKTKFLPGGTSQLGQTSRKDHDFPEFERWLMKRTCSIMGVQPASIGYSDGQYKVTQDESMSATSEFGVHQLLAWRKLHYDDVLEKLGYPDLECQNVTEQEEDQGEVVKRHVLAVGGGILTPNEARKDQGLDAMEGGDTLLIPTTLRTLDQTLNPPEPPTTAPSGGEMAGKPGQGGSSPKPGDGNSRPAQRGEGLSWFQEALERAEGKFGCAMVYLGAEDAQRVRDWTAALIDPEDLVEAEDTPHITVRYGLHTEDGKEVSRALKGATRPEAVLGEVGIFTPGEFDVVRLDVESPDLIRLNELLGTLAHTDTHPVYVPHMTLAYVKPGTGQKYVGPGLLKGKRLTFSEVIYSTAEKVKTTIPLAPSPLSAREAALRLWMRKSLTRLKEGKGADVEFTHPALTTDEVLEIRAQLAQLQDQGQVRLFFEALGKRFPGFQDVVLETGEGEAGLALKALPL